MRRQLALLTLSASLLAACERSATTPDTNELSASDASSLAEVMDGLGSALVNNQVREVVNFYPVGDYAVPVPARLGFHTSWSCRAGGRVVMQGATTGELDPSAHSITAETTATMTQNACALASRRIDGKLFTVTTTPSIGVKASHKVVNGVPSGPQTASQKGAVTWSLNDGRSGSCALDITSTFDPAALMHTVKGTMCGRTVDVRRDVAQDR